MYKYRFPWRSGNHFEILIDSTQILEQMLNAIDRARQSIFLEMYLLESGAIMDRFIQALRNAADRDVQSFLLLDDYGAIGLNQKDRLRLEHKNIQLVYYNKLRSYSNLYNLYRILVHRKEHSLFRDHRKLLLADGQTAYVGGVALIDEFDPPSHPEKSWRDTVVKIDGPVVNDWSQLFAESWYKSTQSPLPIQTPKLDQKNDHLATGRVTSNDIQRRSDLVRSFISQSHQAKHRVWFATAYFVPGWRVRRSLIHAAKSGLDVRLLLPGPITDHPSIRYASHRFYSGLLRNGARIFEYQPRFFHAKCIMCDDWISIGSSNFDHWNLRWNLEANQEIIDKDLARQVENIFEQDFANCLEYTYDDWKKRSWRMRLKQWFWRRIEIILKKIGPNHFK